jgi:hypothetical protein
LTLDLQDARPIRTIGKLFDTKIAKDWPGHEILDLPDEEWTPELNRAWMQQGIDNGEEFYLASPINPETLYNKPGLLSGFGDEIQQLVANGYKQSGVWMVPGW